MIMGRSPGESVPRSIITEVSSTPAEWRSVVVTDSFLAEDGIDLGPDLCTGGADRQIGERLHQFLRSVFPVPCDRVQFTHWHAVAGHDEVLARFEGVHDASAAVAQLGLADGLGHEPSVAPDAIACYYASIAKL